MASPYLRQHGECILQNMNMPLPYFSIELQTDEYYISVFKVWFFSGFFKFMVCSMFW